MISSSDSGEEYGESLPIMAGRSLEGKEYIKGRFGDDFGLSGLLGQKCAAENVQYIVNYGTIGLFLAYVHVKVMKREREREVARIPFLVCNK